MSFIVAIDGPAGSGKGTVTKLVGDELGLINIDTGATYRCVALETLNKNISIENISSVLWRLSWGHLKLPIFTIAGSSVSWKTVFLFLITTWILKESWMTFVRSHQNLCIFL